MAPLLDHDGILLLLAKFLRTFVYGILTVSLVIYLATTGFTTFQIGIVLSTAVLGGVFSTILVVLFADKVGRRKSLSALSLLTALTGIILAVTSDFVLLAVGLFIGSLSLIGGEIGPFLSIEQSIIPQISTEPERNRAFSMYNFIGYAGFSLGSLAGVIPEILEKQVGFPVRDSYLPVFSALILAGLVLAAVYQAFGLRVEAATSNGQSRISLPRSSRKAVLKLSALFSLDSFAGGFVIQSIISLWFFRQFGVSLSSLSLIIATGQVVTALSTLAAGRVADRIGLLNTMVFTHIASNVFLASIAFATVLPVAVVLYLARQSLSQMDVPTRQAYVMALVPQDERTPAAGVTTLSRNISQSVGPTIAGYLLQALPTFLGTLFLLGGGLKIAYDLLLYRSFRNVPLPKPDPQK
ncbi:MAG TPA: MFS transporter [Candidatus Bathyarchaeia archaeon]